MFLSWICFISSIFLNPKYTSPSRDVTNCHVGCSSCFVTNKSLICPRSFIVLTTLFPNYLLMFRTALLFYSLLKTFIQWLIYLWFTVITHMHYAASEFIFNKFLKWVYAFLSLRNFAVSEMLCKTFISWSLNFALWFLGNQCTRLTPSYKDGSFSHSWSILRITFTKSNLR